MESYPLNWPDYQPRTPRHQVKASQFNMSLSKATNALLHEVRLMKGSEVVVSSNRILRADGMPSAAHGEPDDTGVAVYFNYRSRPMVFACDRWKTVKENVRAIAKTVEAIRGIERWGSSDMMEQAFRGFEALEAPRKQGWREVFGIAPTSGVDADEIKRIYRQKAMEAHPDHGGSPDEWQTLQEAYGQAMAEAGA